MTQPLADTNLAGEPAPPTPPTTTDLADDTALPRTMRPDVSGGLELRRMKQQVEAALFGAPPDAATIGRHRVLHRIGEGGMGLVYAAYDERLDRRVALKLIRPSRSESHQRRERTLREARALARLSHPNVVHVYEVGEADGQIYIVMEHLAGPTLRAWLDADTGRPWREVLAVMRQAGEGLAAAHAEGIVHRDFKPQNTMFGADGRVRVLDFGLARIGGDGDETRPGADAPDAPLAALTASGAWLGTPAYMAPEQFGRLPATPRSDQFSFCVALYEALYGERPFPGSGMVELVQAVTSGAIAPRPPGAAVPEWVHAVVVRGLRRDPATRWPSMTALLAALAREPVSRRNARTRAAAFSLALTGALGGVWWRAAADPADHAERERLAQEAAEARATAVQESTARRLLAARAQLDLDPAAAITGLAELAERTDDGVTLGEVRTLALAAAARGLPDAVLVGPAAPVVDVAVAGGSGHAFAIDESGGVWRWAPDETRGARIGEISEKYFSAVAASGSAWVGGWADTAGAREVGGQWRSWQVTLPRDTGGYLKRPRKISADERWAISDFNEPVLAIELTTGATVADAFPPTPEGMDQGRAWVSPDARRLVRAVQGAGTIAAWSRDDGQTRTLPALGAFDGFYGSSSDGRFLLGTSAPEGSSEPRPVVWDLERGTAAMWEAGRIADIAGDHVALVRTTATDPVLCVAELSRGTCAWQGPLADADATVKLTADGRAHAVEVRAGLRSTRGRVEIATGAHVRRFTGPMATDGSIGPDGRYFMGRGRGLDVWTATGGAHELVATAAGRPASESAADGRTIVSPRGDTLVLQAEGAGELVRVDAARGASERLAACVPAGASATVVADDSGRVLATFSGGACLWGAGPDPAPMRLEVPGAEIRMALLAPDGRGFATLQADGAGTQWLDPAGPLRRFQAGSGKHPHMQYAGEAIVTTTARAVRLHDATGPRELWTGEAGEGLVFAATSRNGNYAVAHPGEGDILVHDVAAGTTRATGTALPVLDSGFHELGIRDDGAVVVRSTGEKIYVVDVATDTFTVLDPGVRFGPMRLDPAGDLLFLGAEDGLRALDLKSRTSVVLWPIADARGLMRLGRGKFFVDDAGTLVVHDGKEVHRLALAEVPREPAALRDWLRAGRVRLAGG